LSTDFQTINTLSQFSVIIGDFPAMFSWHRK
jgi:hypothetical protein